MSGIALLMPLRLYFSITTSFFFASAFSLYGPRARSCVLRIDTCHTTCGPLHHSLSRQHTGIAWMT